MKPRFKTMIVPVLAVLLAIGASSFTIHSNTIRHASTERDMQFYWWNADLSVYIGHFTAAEAQEAYSCTTFSHFQTCLKGYSQINNVTHQPVGNLDFVLYYTS